MKDIEQALSPLEPSYLKVANNSESHKSHYKGEGITHIKIEISSPLFSGFDAIECHKLIYKCLDSLLKENLHAVEIKIIRIL